MNFAQFTRNTLILLLLFTFPPGIGEARSELAPSPATLFIQSGDQKYPFGIEIADTLEKWERGLMFRKELSPMHGMLFIFPKDNIAQFWMKNTLIPLDMLFIDSQWKIIKIEKNATPKSLAVISSGLPVKAVLEIPGGTSDSLKLQPGDMVSYALSKKQ